MTYEEYMALDGKEQEEYMKSFSSVEAFFDWYNAAKDTYEKEIDRETFESRVKTYIKTKEQHKEQETPKDNEKNENGLNELLLYIQNNLIQVIIIVIFIVLVIITTIVTIKQSRKSRRLE